jgi:hypothetical protein
MGGDVEKLAFEALEPAAPLGFLLQPFDRHSLADPETHQGRKPQPRLLVAVAEALTAASQEERHHCAIGVNWDHDLSRIADDLSGGDRALEARAVSDSVLVRRCRLRGSRGRDTGQEAVAQHQ